MTIMSIKSSIKKYPLAKKYLMLYYNITLKQREISTMQVLSSLKSAKLRHKDCQIVRRRGKLFVICKSNPRFKARQG